MSAQGFFTFVTVGSSVFLATVWAANRFLPDIVPSWIHNSTDQLLVAVPLLVITNGLTFLLLNGFTPLFSAFDLV